MPPSRTPQFTRIISATVTAGLLTTERDPRGRPTIYDRLPQGLLGFHPGYYSLVRPAGAGRPRSPVASDR